MIKGEILRQLFRSLDQQDELEINEALKNLIKFERQHKNYALANELKELIPSRFKHYNNQKNMKMYFSLDLPKDASRDIPLIDLRKYDLDGNQIILSSKNKKVLDRIIQEYHKRTILEVYNQKNISKLLFFGPPGCGKTLSAKVLSSQLQIPLVYVRFDGLISSYLGETSANLKKIFDFVKEGEWILFFDEFDAIGKSRDDLHDNGEMKRVINGFIQQIDNYTGNAIIICATNFYKSLDPAIWRRFEEIIFFDYPDKRSRTKLFKLFISRFFDKDIDYKDFAQKTEGMSGADIEQICKRALKKSIVEERDFHNNDIYSEIDDQLIRNKYKTHFLISDKEA